MLLCLPHKVFSLEHEMPKSRVSVRQTQCQTTASHRANSDPRLPLSRGLFSQANQRRRWKAGVIVYCLFECLSCCLLSHIGFQNT